MDSSTHARRVVVVGAGISGTAVAAELAARGLAVTVLDRGPAGRLVGSTGHAPGFVGLLGEEPVLTRLARASAAVYQAVRTGGRAGFDAVGGLEIALTDAGVRQLERRADAARDEGLAAHLLTPRQAADAAPDLVDPDRCAAALLSPGDGTARARLVTVALRERATAAGAVFLPDAAVAAVDTTGGRVRSVTAGGQVHPADDVVLAAGVWGGAAGALAGQDLPLVPVAHPYVHGPERAHRSRPQPFVRWPEAHVYARDHGTRLGLGTYDHAPVPVPVEDLGAGVELPWTAPFEAAVQAALTLLPAATRPPVADRLNGVFAMTADNLPLLGPVPAVAGLWAAQALWVTHAAGPPACSRRP